MEEGVLALARLVSTYKLSLDPERHAGPLQLSSALTVTPQGGIWLRLQRRG